MDYDRAIEIMDILNDSELSQLVDIPQEDIDEAVKLLSEEE